jgi:hypothetical protein
MLIKVNIINTSTTIFIDFISFKKWKIASMGIYEPLLLKCGYASSWLLTMVNHS